MGVYQREYGSWKIWKIECGCLFVEDKQTQITIYHPCKEHAQEHPTFVLVDTSSDEPENWNWLEPPDEA